MEKRKMKKNKTVNGILKILAAVGIAAAVIFAVVLFQLKDSKFSGEMTVEKASQIVNETLSDLPETVSAVAKFVEENTVVTVNDITYGHEKNVILDCTYETIDIGKTIEENAQKYINNVYAFYRENSDSGKKTNATKIKLFVAGEVQEDVKKASNVSGNVKLEIFEVEDGKYSLYLGDDVVNTVFGGILDAQKTISSKDTAEYNGEEVNIQKLNTIKTGIKDCFTLKNYSKERPDTSIPILKLWNTLKYDFTRNFITEKRYMYLVTGLLTTLEITACAVLLGIIIGFIVAIIRCTFQKTGKLKILDKICQVYLSVMRGTPVMVQLLIMYFVILLPMGVEKFPAAVLCFGLNSGAYVAEIVRGGIMSIDDGQTEAGRSLGLTYIQTMWYIVIPQAFKAVLPSLANEFIALLKESSVAFYIGVADLTLGGIKIRSITYSNFMPLIAIALIYLVIVLGLSKCVSILERRLRKGDNR